MSSAAIGGPLTNAVHITEINVVLANPIGWMVAPVLELDTGVTSPLQKHFKRGETILRWVLEDKLIIGARSEARLRLLRTRRGVLHNNKLKLEREWTLPFHEMAIRDPTGPYILRARDQIIKVYFDDMSAPPTVEAGRDTASAGVSYTEILGPCTQGVVPAVDSAKDQIYSFLDKFAKFNDIVSGFAEIHPYANAAWIILSVALKMIIAQVNRDNSIGSLLRKMDEVYTFLTGEELRRIESMKIVVERITRQTLECSYFIQEYWKNEKFRTRFMKNLLSGADDRVKDFNGVFDNLMQEFRNNAAGDTLVVVHRIWNHLEELPEDLDFNDMPYIEGAGLNTQKLCLEGTRGGILSDITDWINNGDAEDTRVYWLHGTAGSGKSAIAHTIARHFKSLGRLGSFFSFDRNEAAEQRHKKIFTTIAQDLARCDPQLRKELANAIHHNTSLRKTPDILQQWEELIVKPAQAMSEAIAGPIVIIIDALDESGNVDSRRNLLRILAGKSANAAGNITSLPPHFRILLTSRLLPDIGNAFKGISHVRRQSMEAILSSENDILRYVSNQLSEVELGIDHVRDFAGPIARKSGGLFEWARLACGYVNGENDAGVGLTAEERFRAIVDRSGDVPLLDDMYKFTLETMFPPRQPQREIRIARFKSIMAQILGTMEPLPLASLELMRHHFVDNSDFNVRSIVIPMGALLSGIADSESTPIRALHASFPDFLMNHDRSGEYFIDVSSVKENLAFSCLGVMKHGLRFNICGLSSSYLPNSEVPDLDDRIKERISPELAYSCRFWTVHVCETPFSASLADAVRTVFSDEELLFWLEVLSLLKSINTCAGLLSSLIQWIMPHEEYKGIADDATDVQRFLRLFSGIITFSTPHLYLSALPFSPRSSGIFTKLADKFCRSAKIISDHNARWSVVQGELRGHSDRVESVAFSPDGKRIVSGSYDKTIRMWDAETGKPLRAPMEGHEFCVNSVAFSPDGKRIVSGSSDWTIRLWDAETGEPLRAPLEGHQDGVWSVAFSPDDKRIVSGSHDKAIRLWDAETGEPLRAPLEGHEFCVNSVAFSPDGKRIVSGSDDSTIRLWDAETGESLQAPSEGYQYQVSSVAFSPDGKRIASGSSDMTIRLWDAETGEPLRAPLEGHQGLVSSVAFSPDGKHIVSGSCDNTIRLWDADTGEPLGAPLEGHQYWVNCVAFSPDGKRIVSGSCDNTIRLWDAETGPLRAPLEGHQGLVLSVAFSPDGKCIVSGSDDNTIRLWDAETGELLRAPLEGHQGWVGSVAFSPDGKRTVSGSLDRTIRLWDAETGELLRAPLEGHQYQVSSVAFSPDGKRIMSGSSDMTIRLWDAETGEPLRAPLKGHQDLVSSVAFSPDGKQIVSGSHDMTIRLWDAETGELLRAPLEGHQNSVFSVAFSSDGKCIVSGSDDMTIRLWDAVTGGSLGAPLEGHQGSVLSVSFSPDGKHILSGSSDMTIRLWDAETGEPLRAPLKGHQGLVRSVAFSPDGKCIVSGSSDMTIRLWDAETGEPLRSPLKGHQGSVRSVALLLDSKRIMSGLESDNMMIQLFNVDAKVSSPMFVAFREHALHDPAGIFQHTKKMNEEGWFTGCDGELLFWVPPDLRHAFSIPGGCIAIPRGVEVDVSRMAHGDEWYKVGMVVDETHRGHHNNQYACQSNSLM